MRTCSAGTSEVDEGGVRKCKRCDGLCPKGKAENFKGIYLKPSVFCYQTFFGGVIKAFFVNWTKSVPCKGISTRHNQ